MQCQLPCVLNEVAAVLAFGRDRYVAHIGQHGGQVHFGTRYLCAVGKSPDDVAIPVCILQAQTEGFSLYIKGFTVGSSQVLRVIIRKIAVGACSSSAAIQHPEMKDRTVITDIEQSCRSLRRQRFDAVTPVRGAGHDREIRGRECGGRAVDPEIPCIVTMNQYNHFRLGGEPRLIDHRGRTGTGQFWQLRAS